jgi:hypothetical protein
MTSRPTKNQEDWNKENWHYHTVSKPRKKRLEKEKREKEKEKRERNTERQRKFCANKNTSKMTRTPGQTLVRGTPRHALM